MAILVNSGKIFTLNDTAINLNPNNVPAISGAWTFVAAPVLPEGNNAIAASGLSFYDTSDPDGTIWTDFGVTSEAIVFGNNNGANGFYPYTADQGWTLNTLPDTIHFEVPVNRADNPEFYDWFVANATPVA